MTDRNRDAAVTEAKPLLNPQVIILTVSGGYRAFDTEKRIMHRLNPAAALVLELADGARTESQVVETLEPLIGRDKAQKTRQWITGAFEQGLLVDAEAAVPAPTLDAAAISSIATEMRWADDVQSAYLLQKHATEMDGDDPDQWYRLGELAHIVGDRDTARHAYENYQRSHPEDAEIRHILIALQGESPPARAPDECIDQIYGRFAAFYETNMCDDLKYRAPDHLAAAFGPWLKNATSLNAADLGCGTGLFGAKLKPHCRNLVGVDLSAAMLAKAQERKIYDELTCAELTGWLANQSDERFDLLSCCDTLIYFGDLKEVIAAAISRLRPGGKFGFTLEKSDKVPFRLGDSGRFRHHRSHIQAAAKLAGAEDVRITEKVLRREYGEDVVGLVTVLSKPVR
jgi:predicted TPR repeat methyltransferase